MSQIAPSGFPVAAIEGIKRVLMLAGPFAAMTKTKWDDFAVAFLSALVGSQETLDTLWAALNPEQQAELSRIIN